jgi:hypothetical protein
VVTLAGLAAGTAAVLGLHVVRPDRSTLSSRLSEYAVGRYGGLMTVACLALAVGVLGLAVAIWPRSRLVGILSGVAAVGLMLSAAYPTGVSSTTELLHSVASTAATVALTGAAAVGSLQPRESWCRTLLSRLLAGGAVVGLLVSPWLHDTAYSGLGQRALWLLLVGWMATTVATSRSEGSLRERTAAGH